MMEQRNEEFAGGYVPRPKWQVWGARAALVVLIVGIILYYWHIAHPV